MPDKLQEHQAEAIRKAISGENELFHNVRNARNLAAELPEGVSRTDIGRNLTLFRCNRYDNDTVPLLVYFDSVRIYHCLISVINIQISLIASIL